MTVLKDLPSEEERADTRAPIGEVAGHCGSACRVRFRGAQKPASKQEAGCKLTWLPGRSDCIIHVLNKKEQ